MPCRGKQSLHRPARRRGTGRPPGLDRSSNGLFTVSSFWSTPVILSPEMREGSPHLFAETPKFLIGYYAEFSNDRDLKNRRRSPEIVKCVADLLIPFMDEPICGKVTVVLVAAWIR